MQHINLFAAILKVSETKTRVYKIYKYRNNSCMDFEQKKETRDLQKAVRRERNCLRFGLRLLLTTVKRACGGGGGDDNGGETRDSGTRFPFVCGDDRAARRRRSRNLCPAIVPPRSLALMSSPVF